MGYGDHWQNAQDAARRRSARSARTTAPRSCCSAATRKRTCARRRTRGRLEAAINAAKVGSGRNALRSRAEARREHPRAIAGEAARGAADQRFPAHRLERLRGRRTSRGHDAHDSVGRVAAGPNVSVPSVTFGRASFSGQERVTVTAGIANKSDQPATNVPVTLEIDGHELQTEHVTIAANASGSVSFTPFTLAEAERERHGARRQRSISRPTTPSTSCSTPSAAVSILVIENGSSSSSSLYLSKALSIGSDAVVSRRRRRRQPRDAGELRQEERRNRERRAVAVGRRRRRPEAVRRARWRPAGRARRPQRVAGGLKRTVLPGRLAAIVDRTNGRGDAIGFIDYSHPVFEVFKAPRSGDFSCRAHLSLSRDRAGARRARPREVR